MENTNNSGADQKQDENIVILHGVVNAAIEAGVVKGSINDKQAVFNALYGVAGYSAKIDMLSKEVKSLNEKLSEYGGEHGNIKKLK